ncbi:PE-PGRS family protein PE_PGRS26 [Mycobacterium innocens]|uniref:PE-PGRS family protein PE_PGRS26 n=1 Tax=Mycobacterium innocens TaxID=2341083 RepID=A0A498QD97_9MYCO|nr:PE-PGRS family protein PE_PGRS26 [Mycobacterium innocens]
MSAAIASVFAAHAQAYQDLGAQAAAFRARFVQALAAAGSVYAGAEAVNASPLQPLEKQILGAVNAPTRALLGRPMIGNGADGTATTPTAEPAGCCTATAARATASPAPLPPSRAATVAPPH